MKGGILILFASAVVRAGDVRIFVVAVEGLWGVGKIGLKLFSWGGKMGRGCVGGAMGLRFPGWRKVGRWCAFLGLGCQSWISGASFVFAAAAAAVSVGEFAAACWEKWGWRCAVVSGGPYQVLRCFLAFDGGRVG